MVFAFEQYFNLVVLSLLCLFGAFVIVIEIKTEFENTRYYPLLKVVFGVPFLIANCLVNWLLSPLFFDLPASPVELVTARMVRYKKLNPHGSRLNEWRIGFAIWLCRHLNRRDAGHC